MSEPQATGERATDTPHDVADDWVTVAEAARRLGITARSVRRHVERLADADRDIADADARNVRNARDERNRPVRLVRLSSLKAAPGPDADADADNVDTDARNVHHVRDATDARDVLIEQLTARLADAQGERDAWKTQAQAAQETTARLVAQLADSDARLASVLAATGRVQLSEAPDATGTEASPNRSTPESGNVVETVEARPWWRWWG